MGVNHAECYHPFLIRPRNAVRMWCALHAVCRRRYTRSTKQFASSKRNFASLRTRSVAFSKHARHSSRTSPSRRRPSRSTRRSVWVCARRCRWIPRSVQFLSCLQYCARLIASLASRYEYAPLPRLFSSLLLFLFLTDLKQILPSFIHEKSL